MSGADVLETIGDPRRLDSGLRKLQQDAKLLSSKHANLLANYPERWIALYDGQVRADAPSLERVLAEVDELSLPREEVVIRYLDRSLRRMILTRGDCLQEHHLLTQSACAVQVQAT